MKRGRDTKRTFEVLTLAVSRSQSPRGFEHAVDDSPVTSSAASVAVAALNHHAAIRFKMVGPTRRPSEGKGGEKAVRNSKDEPASQRKDEKTPERSTLEVKLGAPCHSPLFSAGIVVEVLVFQSKMVGS